MKNNTKKFLVSRNSTEITASCRNTLDSPNQKTQHNQQLSPADQVAGSQMFRTNLILPGPCQFLSPELPAVSIFCPTSTRPGGAVATIRSFVADNLFLGQSKAFF